ncbi:MAG: c-type cytochrome [Thiobacillaceae bacterium]
MHIPTLVAALILSSSLSACGKKEETTAPEAAAPAAAPEPAPVASAPATDTPAALAAAGESKYKTVCAVCHGQKAEGMGNYPRLAGLSSDEISNKLMDYRAGKQMGPLTAIMAATAKNLSDEEIAALAAYLGNLGR